MIPVFIGFALGFFIYELSNAFTVETRFHLPTSFSKQGLGSGAIFALWAFFLLQINISMSIYWVLLLSACLYLIARIDNKFLIIPNELVVLVSILAVLTVFYSARKMPLQDRILGAFLGAGFLLLLRIVVKKLKGVNAMGLGDVKLMIPLGFIIGYLFVMHALLFASLIGTIHMSFYKKKHVGEKMAPFGPSLIVGFWIMYLYGEQIFLGIQGVIHKVLF